MQFKASLNKIRIN